MRAIMERRWGYIFLVFVYILGCAEAPLPKQCLYFRGKCVERCPLNMHPYHTRCDSETMSQRTCIYQEPYILGFTCGWSRCDCNGDLVLSDRDGEVCVPVSDCVNDNYRPPNRKNRKRRRKGKSYSRLRDTDDLDDMHKGLEPVHNIGDEYNVENMYVPAPAVPMPLQGNPYTGHCPLLKFRYGKCYGDNTRQILREIRSKGLFNKPLEYRPGDHYEVGNMPRRDKPLEDVYDGLRHRQPAYMTGYTGYVPGMSFRYGKSYGRAADDCMTDFADHQRQLRRKADLNKSYIRSRSAPKMETIHSRDEIRRELNKFREINKYKENTISPEFPPIAGYTGHIPRIKGSEASLSQRYHCAAKRGLELIRMEKDQRNELQNADANVREILREKEKKYSYWNWG